MGNGMVGDQRIQRFVDPTSGCRDMPSPRSQENVVQGQLVILGPGAKNQTERRKCGRRLQVCMGNADVGRPPTLARSRVLQS